jgi:hypothetical protein
MTNGTAPSAVTGDTYPYATYGGVPLQIAIPYLLSPPTYTDLPRYWTWRRDVVLQATIHKEDMWAAAVARTATKFAAHSFTIRDSKDSKLRVKNSQQLMTRANGGQGWVPFAEPLMQDYLTTDNGVFIRIRHADDETQSIKTKAFQVAGAVEQTFDEVKITNSSPGSKIVGLYHLDSLRCMRTGNLMYPVRYQPVLGAPQLLRWDQVLFFADQPSPRAELYGIGFCAASRAYKTIANLAALRQMLYEFVAGKGATKVSFVQGIGQQTLENVLKAGEANAQAKGLVYFLGTILGAIPSDTPLSLTEVLLKQLPSGFDMKQVLDDAYLLYANAIGIPVQDIQPLSGQGLGTGTQSVVLQEQSTGIGLAAFLKWWEQTVSDRILPATTELSFDNEHDVRDQQARAQAKLTRAQERAARITSGEISPPIARQLAADSDDLPQELLAQDVTPGGQISDDEKPGAQNTTNPAAMQLIGTEPAAPAAPGATALASAGKSYDALFAAELAIAKALARWAND